MEILLLIAIVAVGAVWYYNAQAKKSINTPSETVVPSPVEIAPELAPIVEVSVAKVKAVPAIKAKKAPVKKPAAAPKKPAAKPKATKSKKS